MCWRGGGVGGVDGDGGVVGVVGVVGCCGVVVWGVLMGVGWVLGCYSEGYRKGKIILD
jgi:hypothetical protein